MRKPTDTPDSDEVRIEGAVGESGGWNGVDRRETDRRHRPTRPWIGWRGPFRRTRGRRANDEIGYVDRYSRRDVALILAVFLMNVGDAFLTMLWLERGGREANPIMDFFLDIGPGAFIVQKCFVVGIWLVILVVHKNFRFARIGLYASLVVYALLMVVHFGIIALGITPPESHDAGPANPALDRPAPQIEDPFGTSQPLAINRRDVRPTEE